MDVSVGSEIVMVGLPVMGPRSPPSTVIGPSDIDAEPVTDGVVTIDDGSVTIRCSSVVTFTGVPVLPPTGSRICIEMAALPVAEPPPTETSRKPKRAAAEKLESASDSEPDTLALWMSTASKIVSLDVSASTSKSTRRSAFIVAVTRSLLLVVTPPRGARFAEKSSGTSCTAAVRENCSR